MQNLLKHVHELASKIGPRGTTTEAETKAGTYIIKTLKSLGWEVSAEPFRTITSFSYVQGLYLIGFLASWGIFWVSPRISAFSSFLLLTTYLLDIETFWSIAPSVAKKSSRNIRSKLPSTKPPQETPEHIVIMAHYDSSKAAMNFHPKMVGGFRQSFLILMNVLVLLTLTILLQATGLLTSLSPPIFFWLSLPLVIYLVGVLLTLVHRELFCQFTPGANDNASGVAVLLGLAEHLQENPPKNVTVELVATGAEEAGTFGSLAYIKQHGIANKRFINLDNLGNGDLFVTTAEGIIRKQKADSKLLQLATDAASQHPPLSVGQKPYQLLTTDATPIMARKGRAMSIMAADSLGLLPNWHWVTDTEEHIVPSNLANAQELVARMIQILDSSNSSS